MVSILALWLPILVAAIFVFAASSVIHMFLPYHRKDFKQVPREDDVMADLRTYGIPPGDYVIPYAGGDPEVMKSEDFKQKAADGPVAFMTVLPSDDPFAMGAQLTQWFLYCLLVSLFAGYIAGQALGPGAEYLKVFQFSGATAFAGYGLAQMQGSIWFGRAWSTTIKNLIDALIYAMLTAGAFGWLWPA